MPSEHLTMKESIASIVFTAFTRLDADAHVERLQGELHAARTGVYATLTLRGTPQMTLKPSWLRGELAALPPYQIEMAHTVSERHGRFYCTTQIGVAGPPPLPSPDEEPAPITVRACPSSRRH